MHGLIQAFSRTNRILNSIKTYGNIICFRKLQQRMENAIALFGDREASSTVLVRTFKDYYYGYTNDEGKHVRGYVELVAELQEKFPPDEHQIIGEAKQKLFIQLFGAFLRLRNLLSSFDEFAGKEAISERDLQDYTSTYQDLRDEWNQRHLHGEKSDITYDVIFEIELVKQIEVNIDYILMLVKKYHDSNCEDKEILVSIGKAIDASPSLRSKKQLIQSFIDDVNDSKESDIIAEWNEFVYEQREKELEELIRAEKLKPEATRSFLENAFAQGEIKTSGTDIDSMMPPVSRFAKNNQREEKKLGLIDRLKAFFEKYFGIGGKRSFLSKQEVQRTLSIVSRKQNVQLAVQDNTYQASLMAAEEQEGF